MNIELELYKTMYLIRACEEAIIKYYPENEMKTPMHMSAYSEHISSAICLALGDKAQIFSSYRSHAPFLARTGDSDQFFLEMYGKKESVIGGRGGSMHLCYPEKGFIMSSAIVASQIPVACGYAWANKMKKNDKIVVVFFGDGAVEEGCFWESLNIACLMKIKIIFVYEDNDLAVYTSKKERKGYDSFVDIVKQFNCKVESYLGLDGKVIYEIVKEYIDSDIRTPLFLETKYYRHLEHVGINEDYEAGYRVKSDYEVDPVKVQREKLVVFLGDATVQSTIEGKIDLKVEKSIELVRGK